MKQKRGRMVRKCADPMNPAELSVDASDFICYEQHRRLMAGRCRIPASHIRPPPATPRWSFVSCRFFILAVFTADNQVSARPPPFLRQTGDHPVSAICCQFVAFNPISASISTTWRFLAITLPRVLNLYENLNGFYSSPPGGTCGRVSPSHVTALITYC